MNDKKLRVLWPILLIAQLAGCAPQSRVTNLTPLDTWGNGSSKQPKVTAYVDPDATFQKYKTFALLPYSQLTGDKSALNPIGEKQMLFFLRNRLEAVGFQYVSTQDSADFVATMNASNEYREHYVEPQTVQVPVWVPSRTITSSTSTTGDVSAYSSSDYGNGTYRESKSTQSVLPGYMSAAPETRAGYYVGFYYPEVSIFAYDTKSSRNIFQATGSGISRTADPRVACQQLAAMCSSNIPPPSIPYFLCTPTKAAMGAGFTILTTDGNSYWPAVTTVVPNGPADNADLEGGDIILSINGIDTRGQDIQHIYCQTRGDVGSKCVLLVWRLGKRLPLTITMSSRDEVYKQK